jgi:hypothetical protein
MLGYLQVAFLGTQADSDGRLVERNNEQRQRQTQSSISSSSSGSGSSSSNVDGNGTVMNVELWGCDLLPGPSPDLAMFSLFHAAHAASNGRFNAVTGQYQLSSARHQQPVGDGCDAWQHSRPRLPGHEQYGQPTAAAVCASGPGDLVAGYACLHDPAMVLSPAQLAAVADRISHHASAAAGICLCCPQQLQPRQLAEGSQGALSSSWERGVLGMLEPHPTADLASRNQDLQHEHSSQAEPAEGHSGRVSGLVVCGGATTAAAYDSSGAMRCLSTLLAELEA